MAFFGRGKNKIENSYTLRDMYKSYIKDIDLNSPYYVGYNTYKEIATAYLKQIGEYIYETSLEYRLPHSLGGFQLVKKKRNLDRMFHNSQIDWENTVKYGKKVYHVNEHSDGYRYFFMWNKNGKLLNISRYRFVPTRTNKRKLANYVKTNKRDYFEVK